MIKTTHKANVETCNIVCCNVQAFELSARAIRPLLDPGWCEPVTFIDHALFNNYFSMFLWFIGALVNSFPPAPPDLLRGFRCWEAEWGLWSRDRHVWLLQWSHNGEFSVSYQWLCRKRAGIGSWQNCICKSVRKYAACRWMGHGAERLLICIASPPRGY